MKRHFLVLVGLLALCPRAWATENPEFLRVKAVLAAKSNIPPVAKIAPYREALAVYEWAVQSGVSGSAVAPGTKLRVQHWVYYDNVKQSAADWPVGHETELCIERSEAHSEAQRFCVLDTLPLDVDIPVFFDVGQPLTIPTEAAVVARAAALTKAMLVHRDKVRLIALGDSRTARGLNMEPFYGGAARDRPLAFNLAEAGSRVPSLEYKSRQCSALLPALEWVVINVSPRMFTVGMSGTNVTVLGGPPWPEKLGKPGKAEPSPEIRISADLPSRTAPPLTACDFSLESWAVFEGMVRELNRLGVNTLLWTPPMRDRGTNDDFAPAGKYWGTLQRLRALTQTYTRCFLVDFMVEHRDRFVDADFADQDHLNKTTGGAKLGRLLDEFREAPTWAHRLKISDTAPGRRWTALRHGTPLYLGHPGRSFDFVPRALLDLPFLQGKLGDRDHRGPVVFSFQVDRPVRVYVIGFEDSLKMYDWIVRDFKATEFRMGEMVVWAREYPPGTITFGPKSDGDQPRMMYTVAVEPVD